MKKQQFSLAQHEKLGQDLATLSVFFGTLTGELSRRYGKSSRPAKCSDSIYHKLLRLRSDMEAPLFSGHPKEATTRVYYPMGQLGEFQTPNVDCLLTEENEGKVYL